ncbi:DUF998 domain-containing protein [Streptomyces sp. NPDC002004]
MTTGQLNAGRTQSRATPETTTRWSRLGLLAWAFGAVQFFVIHFVVESAWPRAYSWAANNISDLGNIRCEVRTEPESRYVCSPRHELMNVSFTASGLLLLAGALLTWRIWSRRPGPLVSRILLAGAGAGFVLVGLAPSDTRENAHVLGALLIMATGNAGLILAGFGTEPGTTLHRLRHATRLLGTLALLAAFLHLSGHYLGLGMGGMERVAVFPLFIWTFTVGAVGLSSRARNLSR